MAAPGIVVLGVPRSGTTLLRRLLDAHPRIACGAETFLLRAAGRFLRGDLVADGIDYGVVGGLKAAGFSEDEVLGRLRALVEGFLAEHAARQGKPRWACKSAVDSFYSAEVERLFGARVRYLILLRHGLDVAASLADLCAETEAVIEELRPYLAAEPRPVVGLARAWAEVTQSLLALAERQGGNALLVRYESLVADPDAELARIGAFLDERFEPGHAARALAAPQADGLGDARSFDRKDVDQQSVERWRALSATTLAQALAVAAPTLERCGYPPPRPPTPPDADQALRRYQLAMMSRAAKRR